LAAILAFPAFAETAPKTPPASSSAPQAGSTAENAPAGAKAPPSEAKPEENAAGEDVKPEDAKPEGESSAATAPEQPKSSVLINIDKSSQEMTVFVDGVEQYSWPVSTGMRGYSTPSGTYTTRSMNKIWYSKQWDNAPMPHAVFFTKEGHAIHGTTEVKRLGKPASHGCVRLAPENAAKLYALVEANGLENTQVVLAGTTPGGEGPKVASQGSDRQPNVYPPWFAPGDGFYQQPQPQKRRGLFGRRWFQPFGGPQGYYAPRGYYRGLGPRGY
jgi:lipoprotein-anchoring transpeptidase ErfK/SrfK